MMVISGLLSATCLLSYLVQGRPSALKTEINRDIEWPTPLKLSEYKSFSLPRKRLVLPEYMYNLYNTLVNGSQSQSNSLPLGADSVRSFTHSGRL